MKSLPAAIGLPILAFLAGCGQPTASTNPGDVAIVNVPAVKLVALERKTLVHTIEQPGTLEALNEAPLFARIPGYVRTMRVDIGDKVKGPNGKDPGQVLAELSVPEVEELHRQKQALVVRAEAAVDQAKASLDAADAHVTTAQALVREAEAGRTRAQANYLRWESETKRIGELVKKNVIDRQTLDETENQFRAAEAGRQEAEAKVLSAQAVAKESEANRTKASADLAASKAQVLVARAEEGQAAANLQYGKLVAPFDGVVTRRTIDIGSFVEPTTGSYMKALFVISRIDMIRVFLDVPEADAAFVHDEMPAQVHVQAARHQDHAAKVTRNSATLDPKARTLRVEVDLPNPEGQLRPGMYAYVTLKAELKDRFVLPSAALVTSDGKPACYVIESTKAVLTPVKLGVKQGSLVEVTAKRVGGAWQPFTGDERVALGNLTEVKDGGTVRVEAGKQEKQGK
jgi:RND family efflux transporter MFP subunit